MTSFIMTSFPVALRHTIRGVSLAKLRAILPWACVAALATLAWPLRCCAAEPADDAQGRLAKLPRPWNRPVHLVTLDEYTETVKYWAEKHPDILHVETPAKASNGMPIYLLKITDSQVPDADKQVALVTSLHGGPERSARPRSCTWPSGCWATPRKQLETRRKQVLLLMPINNPYAYFVTDQFGTPENIEPYSAGRGKLWDLNTLTFAARGRSPEVDAYLSVMDQYRPEVHADAHGIGLQEFPRGQVPNRQLYQGQTMFEITGSAYSNYALRPWDWRVIEAMIAAGREAGFGSERMEADGQRLFWGPGMDPLADKLWHGRPFFYTAHYGYARYHTLITAFEVGWEAERRGPAPGVAATGQSGVGGRVRGRLSRQSPQIPHGPFRHRLGTDGRGAPPQPRGAVATPARLSASRAVPANRRPRVVRPRPDRRCRPTHRFAQGLPGQAPIPGGDQGSPRHPRPGHQRFLQPRAGDVFQARRNQATGLVQPRADPARAVAAAAAFLSPSEAGRRAAQWPPVAGKPPPTAISSGMATATRSCRSTSLPKSRARPICWS